MSPWYRSFGTNTFPIRQSALNAIASQNGCGKRFALEQEELARGSVRPAKAHWKPTLGTAAHAVIERALTKTWEQIVSIYGPTSSRPHGASPGWAPRVLRERVDEVLREELTKAAGLDPDGAPVPVDWYDEHPETEIAAGVAMVIGALRTTAERAESIVACEAPFRAELGTYHLEGTMDLVYRRRLDDALGLVDWKTGARKLPQVLLDHGYQVAAYAHALEHGVLWPGSERELRIGAPPAEIHIAHLRDFVPYVKKPKKAGGKVGDLRGRGWYPSHRAPGDVARLEVSLRTVVGTVRMGRFLEHLGEQCARCPYRGPCLTAGHELGKDEARAMTRALDGIDTSNDGLDEEAA